MFAYVYANKHVTNAYAGTCVYVRVTYTECMCAGECVNVSRMRYAGT